MHDLYQSEHRRTVGWWILEIIKGILRFIIVGIPISIGILFLIDAHWKELPVPVPRLVQLESKVLPVPTPSIEILEYQMINLRRITAYNAVSSQTDASPDISSCGRNIKNQIAVSQDIFFDSYGRKHLCGVEAYLVLHSGETYKVVIYDTMNVRYTESADLLLDDYQQARIFGVRSGYLLIPN